MRFSLLLAVVLVSSSAHAASLVDMVRGRAGGAPAGEVLGALQAVTLPGQPGAAELNQALPDDAGKALQALDRLDAASPDSQEAMRALAAELPSDFARRLRAYAEHPSTAEARALAEALAAAHQRASAKVGDEVSARVRKILENVRLGRSSLGEVEAAAAQVDRYDLYGPSVWTASNDLRQTAAGFHAFGPLETAEETAARLLDGGSSSRSLLLPPADAAADASLEAAPEPEPQPVGALTERDLFESLRPTFEANGLEARDGRDAYTFSRRGRQELIVPKTNDSDGTLSLWIKDSWMGFHNVLAEQGIVLGRLEARDGDMARYEARRERYEPQAAAEMMRDAVLGTGRVRWDNDFVQMRIKAKAALMPERALEAVQAELEKMGQMKAGDSEYGVSRKWVEAMLNMPWSRRTKDRLDLRRARLLIDRDQYGLEKVKQRVLEFLAVKKRTSGFKATVLVFDGPPGVGKTAIAKSIARALGRKFVRVALGGVNGESDIRGHSRTYVGAEAGRIVKGLIEAGTRNPVMLLDEVDKVGRGGVRGDPDAALLEVLDPEQNDAFHDHFLDYSFDLSEVFFIATSNDLQNISKPLLDRMELIRFPSYSRKEKVEITHRHLLPKSLEENGLKAEEARLSRGAIAWLVDGYSRGEGGVRKLKQLVDEVLRKAATAIEIGQPEAGEIGAKHLADYLGPAPFGYRTTTENGVGIVTGLAVGGGGGSVMNVEIATSKGTGKLQLRNQFKEMAEDSARNALAYLKSSLPKHGLPEDALDKINVDVTFTPAINVDGPSAGTLIATGLLSKLTGRPARRGVAMTGEITVTGRVLPIGGLSEKIMAAKREGAYAVIFPRANLAEVQAIPAEDLAGLKLIPVSTADEVFSEALAPAPAPSR